MRRHRFNVALRLTALGALLSLTLGPVTGRAARAQTGTVPEGALDLIRPIGARTMGMGQAAVAGGLGSEALWINPALSARDLHEISFNIRNKSNPVDAESDALGTVMIPFHRVGTVSLSLRYLDNGTLPATDQNNQQTGTIVTSSLVLAATFATTFGDRLAAGFTVKQLTVGFSCTGDCTNPTVTSTNTPSVQAVDFGTQYFVRRDSTLSIGASLVNLGPRFQIIDANQADPLPARVTVGVAMAPKLSPEWKDVSVRGAADVVSRLSQGTGLGYRIGAEVGYQDRYHVRAGYMVHGPGDITSPTLGFGIRSGKLQIDLAQMMASSGIQTARPTFLTLRYDF
jgi:hypothetical protein